MPRKTNPALYILMRSDMASLTPGKAMAQAAHAANAFSKHANDDFTTVDDTAWYCATEQGFGTTIVLDIGSEKYMKEAVEASRKLGFAAEVIHDPTYPIKDGETTHLIPVDTCAYIFTECRDAMPVPPLRYFNLHE